MKVGIIGLGLMGGSFALALKKRYKDKELEIIGLDHNAQHCIEALELKIADKITDELKDLFEVDLLILAIPVDAIVALIPKLKGVSKETTIVDFGSTKEKIVQAIPKEIRPNFIAAHPMTGTEKHGPSAADKKLYRGKVMVLCDTHENNPKNLEFARKIFSDLGMKIIYMNAKEHDLHAAYISHMPHAISYALANSVLSQENPEAIIALAGGGFKDMSRIAKSSAAMWVDIFRQNKKNVVEAINSFEEELGHLKKAIANENWQEVEKLIQKANTLHKIL